MRGVGVHMHFTSMIFVPSKTLATPELFSVFGTPIFHPQLRL
jgi:hypothetical protein